MNTTTVTVPSAGSSRRARRAQKLPSDTVPDRSISRVDEPGDQETRDDEEHVDAEEARGQDRRREVIDDDRRDRDRPQAVEPADVATPTRIAAPAPR